MPISEENYWKHKERVRVLFQNFLRYTDEKRVLTEEIIRITKPKKYWTFLDVGCGSGDITIPIAKKVTKTVAIDYDKDLLNSLLKKSRNLKNIEVLHRDWNKIGFLGEFDLVMASHILLYPSFRGKWNKTIKKLLEHVKKNGYLVIIHYSGTGEYSRMLNKFWFKVRGTRLLKIQRVQNHIYIANILRRMNYNPKTKIVKIHIKIPSLKETLNLVEWFFHIPYNKIKPETQKELIKYFITLKKDNEIVIEGHNGLVWVKRS